MSRSLLVLVLGVATACLACGTPPVPTVAVARATSATGEEPASAGDPWRGLADVVLDGGRAMIQAVRGEPHDARWDCDGAADADLRATTLDARQAFAASGVGASPAVYAIERFELAARPAKDLPNRRWLALRADAVIWPDRRTRWTDLTTTEVDPDEMMRVADLPPPLRAAIEPAVALVARGTCALPFVALADVDALTLPAAHEGVEKKLLTNEREATEACGRMRSASGPWRVRAKNLLVVYRAGERLLTLRSEIVAPSDRVCLGHVQVDASR
jgi:hypothetical protein